MLRLLDVDFLLREPGGVFQCLVYVLGFQIGIIRQNLLLCDAVGNLAYNHGDRNSHAPDTGAASHDFGFKCDTIEHPQYLPGQLVEHPACIIPHPRQFRAARL